MRPAASTSAVLAVEDLAVGRGGRVVAAGVSFRLAAGEALAVTGANGAGKSTLLRTLAGLLRPQAGTIRITGLGADASLPERVHYVGHADGLKSALTAAENLDFARRLLAGPADPPGLAPADALAALGIAALLHLPVGYLSAGQRRRVALARLLVVVRPLWVLDEPLTALDTLAQAELAGLMADHRMQGGLIVAATHAELALTGARELTLAP